MRIALARLCVSILAITGFLPWSIGQEVKLVPAVEPARVERHAAIPSPRISTPCAGELVPVEGGTKWAVSVRSIKSRTHGDQDLAALKAAKLEQKIASHDPREEPHAASRASDPILGINFEANWTLEQTPPDNSLAISNGGFIVTANNDGIEYYTSSGQFLYFDFWYDFLNDGTLTGSLYDPRVHYDSQRDRFILVLLHGSTPSTSRVIVCFSKTNNPQQGWWVYQLTGNPLGNNAWFDYPAIGVSTNELFITGNLFLNQGPFQQSVIYQISKEDGYTGQNLDWQYWSGLSTSPFPAFSLVPASFGHQGNYGPGLYFVSSRSGGDNQVRMWIITDDMAGNPEMESYPIPVSAYSPAPNGFQLGTDNELDNGDCRIQNAFYLNGILHYVMHSDIGDGWNGIHYNRLNVVNLQNQTSTFGLQGSYDYSYPAVASFATSATDRSVMIAFLRTSAETYPQARVVNCDHSMEWSSSTLIKSGETYVNFLSGDTERWGDYTGIARRHSSATPRVWVAGSYGADIPGQDAYNTFKTQVAEIYGNPTVSVDAPMDEGSFQVFPNPAYDLVRIAFTLDTRQPVTIEIVDAQGRIIRQLYHDTPSAGENRLSFNKGALPAGLYTVIIRTDQNLLAREPIILVD